ncbi:nucleotidyltransferase domain-containing protein [Stygiolobus caldivivus]|uniref:nucleotidyltransferase domain-containing protein n=1 Tax=Stygiolobus caldivivus TaxID=2824673 RepID=UPI001C841576|nr:nucleotidyltransferase domain-containing protein [Stygiolobus caldivivus]
MDEPYRSLLEKLVNLMKEKLGDDLVSVVVFGSIARGDYRRDSDIDLFIVIKNLPKTVTERVILFDQFEVMLEGDLERLMDDGYYVTFSPILKTPEEAGHFSPLYMDMTQDAVILYDVNGFFKGVLDKARKKLEELDFERVWVSKKAWYWRKRDYKFGEVIDFGD